MSTLEKILYPIRVTLNQISSRRLIVMIVLSFSMWLMVKLRNTYTTDITVWLTVDNRQYELTCVFEGEGMKLLRYSVLQPELVITLDDVQHRTVKVYDEEAKQHGRKVLVQRIRVAHKSLVDLVNVSFSDIKVVSVSELPDLPIEQ